MQKLTFNFKKGSQSADPFSTFQKKQQPIQKISENSIPLEPEITDKSTAIGSDATLKPQLLEIPHQEEIKGEAEAIEDAE